MLKDSDRRVRRLDARSAPAAAQDYPARPVTMVIPFAAGGPTDVLGRVVAARMSEILGQQVVVENVGGAGGMTGGKRVASAQPDGYQMLLGTVGTQAQGQTLYKKPLYNSVTDFTPVALLAEVPIVLTVRKDLPVNDFKEFVAYAKETRARCSSARPARARRRISAACCSTMCSAPTSRTCPIAAPDRRCRICMAAASISCARSSPPQSRRSMAAP